MRAFPFYTPRLGHQRAAELLHSGGPPQGCPPPSHLAAPTAQQPLTLSNLLRPRPSPLSQFPTLDSLSSSSQPGPPEGQTPLRQLCPLSPLSSAEGLLTLHVSGKSSLSQVSPASPQVRPEKCCFSSRPGHVLAQPDRDPRTPVRLPHPPQRWPLLCFHLGSLSTTTDSLSKFWW